MTSRNRKLVKENTQNKKDKKSQKVGIQVIFERILLITALICTGAVDCLFIMDLTGNIMEYIVIIYLSALCILILILLAAEFIDNFLPNYKDSTWSSYIIYVVIMVPVIVITIYAGIINKWNPAMDVGCLLQFIYWGIAGANFIWFLSHMLSSKDCKQRKELNLLLKLMVVIISGVGLVMDIVGKLNFTKQFLAIAWTVLLMSYISDIKAD